ncbi:hypothetical protein K3495_g1452 [Podosphaera aphanis]|nr:hypothetical protein K3495_g1452 [Podosphaera aphanis]
MEGIFVGYTNSSKIFRIFIPVKRNVVITRQVTFPNTESGEVPIEISHPLSSDPPARSPSTTAPTPPALRLEPIKARTSSPDLDYIPGKYIETLRSVQQLLQATPHQPITRSNFLDAPKKPTEIFILLGIPPVPPINFQPTEPSSSEQPRHGACRRSNRERK